MASQVALVVKKPHASAGDMGSIPGSRRPPGGGNGTHSSVLAWRIPGQRSLAGYSPRGHEESDTTERLSLHARQDRRSWKVGVHGLLFVG